MSKRTPKLKAMALREVRLVDPKKEDQPRVKAALSQLSHTVHADLLQQSDLLHIEAVLVTEGINQNDDAFTRDGLKAALKSPILKPINWQHKDDNILGAMYAVEARDLSGNIVEEIGSEPVELVIQAVVWHHLPHIKATANEIVSRIENGDLFVSMECWFDDYDFGLYTQAGELYDLIPRNNDTAFLDAHLRANGGVGRYNGMRIGRALTGINFGGVAFVDRPANKRSFILNQFAFDPTKILEDVGASRDGLDQDQVAANNVVSDVIPPKLEVNMNDLNRTAASEDQIQAAVSRALAAEKKAAEGERTKAELDRVQAEAGELKNKLGEVESTLAEVTSAVDHAFDSAKAAAAPEEISKIDRSLDVKGAGAGAATLAAKIAWIENSRSKAQEALTASESASANEKLVEENAILKKELAGIKSDIRESEIKHLFANILEMDEAEVKTFVEAGLALETDEAYDAWMSEKKLFAKKMMDLKKIMKEKKKDDSKDKEEAGLLTPSERETSIDDHGAVLRSDHGRVPSDVTRVPRSKLTAAADLDAMFEEVDEPNLAGASTAQGSGQSSMGKLIAGLLSDKRKKENQDN